MLMSMTFMLMGCFYSSNAQLKSWEGLEGCWIQRPNEAQEREQLLLQLVLSDEDPDISKLRYSILTESELLLVAKWRIERKDFPNHPRWAGIQYRMNELRGREICFEPGSVVFLENESEQRYTVTVLSERTGHVQLGMASEVWNVWWDENGAVEFNRTGLSPIHLRRAPTEE